MSPALRLRCGVLALALVPGLAGAAPAVVIYRCVGADGSVLVQNGVQCPKGMAEQKRVLAMPAPGPIARPAPVAAPPRIVAMPTRAAPTTGPGVPSPAPVRPAVPVPALFVCLTPAAQRYYADDDDPVGCAPLVTVGLDGRSPSPAAACETVANRCDAVAEAARCEGWLERRRLAEQALLFSPEQVDTARAELAHVDAALAGTDCRR